MKKILFMMALLMGVTLTMAAKDNYYHDDAVLPQAARTVLTNNFKAKVNLVKVDKTMGRVDDYEVILTDGTEVKFDRNGNWKEVEVGKNGSVPKGFVPDGVTAYVKKNHSGQRVVGIEKERSGYDVELSNGIEMKFSSDGTFIKYDD